MSTRIPARHEILSGERIFFSALRPDDIEQLVRWTGDQEFAAQLGDIDPAAPAAARRAWCARLVQQAAGNPLGRTAFAIIERASHAFLGTAALYRIDQRQRSATLGIGLGPGHWGRGYGSAAARLMVEYGFYQLQLATVSLVCLEANQRGQRAYRRAGFREVARLTSGQLPGRPGAAVLMSISSDEVDLSSIRAMLPRLHIANA